MTMQNSIPVIRERLSASRLEEQAKLFTDKNIIAQLLEASSSYLMVLNEYRQIIYINSTLQNILLNKAEIIPGDRPGEALNCIHASVTPDGCGTSEFCTSCGALQAIISSLNGQEVTREWRITRKDSNEAMDFRVWARPLSINGFNFSVLSFLDISNEKRRMALERIFFHDVLNSATSLTSYLRLFNNSSLEEKEEYLPAISNIVENIIEGIKSQRDLEMAENHELTVRIRKCNSREIILKIKNFYDQKCIVENKKLEIDPSWQSIDFLSDESLVLRVLGNMIKNAVESIDKGEIVKIGCRMEDGKIYFTVNNPGYLAIDIQHQIFHRSFTTKEAGRGLGTYSMKLISENYLKGRVYFTSSKIDGTTFTAEYPLDYYESN